MASSKGWHNQPKYIPPSTAGKCPHCNKRVASLESHVHDKHLSRKAAKNA